MIDLDDQLTAYSEYLDDTERSVVVLRPVRLDAKRGMTRGQLATLAVAAAIAVAGTIAVATITRQRGSSETSVVTDTGEWTVVPDTNGALEVKPGNQVRLSSVAHTSQGWIAVGSEDQGRSSIAAVWRSSDGTSWERVGHDQSFGDDSFSEERPSGSIPDGPYMSEVAEYDGRIIVAGAGSDDEAVIWWTDDLVTWHVTHPFAGSVAPWEFALAVGDAGLVLFAQRAEGGDGDPHTIVGWHSIDGVSWTPALIEDSDEVGINDVVAIEDGYVAVGEDSTPRLIAAAWSSADGLLWVRSAVDESTSDDVRSSSIAAVSARDGIVVGIGRGFRGNQSTSISWTSNGGAEFTAHPVSESEQVGSAGPLVAIGDTFVALGRDDTPKARFVESRSTDGVTWTTHTLDLSGGPVDAAYSNGTAVAVGGSSVGAAIWILRTD